MLNGSTALIFPDHSKTFLLFTDAGDYAMGAILAQLDENGVDQPIAYYSKTFSSAKKNYSVTERLCLAVIWAVKHFRPYVHGVHFKVITDHASLRWLQNMKDPEGRLARWAV